MKFDHLKNAVGIVNEETSSDDPIVEKFKKALGEDGLSLLCYQPRIVIKDGKVMELLDTPMLYPVEGLVPSDIEHLVSIGILKREFAMKDGKGFGPHPRHITKYVESQIRGAHRDLETYDKKIETEATKDVLSFLKVQRESLLDRIEKDMEPILQGKMVGYGYARQGTYTDLTGKANRSMNDYTSKLKP